MTAVASQALEEPVVAAACVRVAVVDDHPVYRAGLTGLLRADPSVQVVAEAACAEDALREVDRLCPDLVLLDVRLPGMSGIEAARLLLSCHPRLGVVIMTGNASRGVLLEAIDAGAHGIVLKESDPEVLRRALRRVAAGEAFLDPAVEDLVRRSIAGRRGMRQRYGLTRMETEVLALLPRGFTNKEIAALLGVSVATVKTHVAHVMRKLDVRNRAGAASLAMSEDLS